METFESVGIAAYILSAYLDSHVNYNIVTTCQWIATNFLFTLLTHAQCAWMVMWHVFGCVVWTEIVSETQEKFNENALV